MALNIGKKMVYLLALSSFTLATWGISLFSTPVLTPVIGADGKPKDGSWQEIDQRKAKIDLWFKEAKDGSLVRFRLQQIVIMRVAIKCKSLSRRSQFQRNII